MSKAKELIRMMEGSREKKFFDAIEKASISKDSKISVFPVYAKPKNGSNIGKPEIVTTDAKEAWKAVEKLLGISDGIEVRVDGVRVKDWT